MCCANCDHFTRYLYTPQPLRTLGEIRAGIEAVEKETEEFLEKTLVDMEAG
jgi:hypothetical protein